jgi:hypothetical protein
MDEPLGRPFDHGNNRGWTPDTPPILGGSPIHRFDPGQLVRASIDPAISSHLILVENRFEASE